MESLYLGSVSLFYAKDAYENTILIDEINEYNKDNEYTCRVCGGVVKPRALSSEKRARHFYHVSSAECGSESILHYWYKNEFIKRGSKFKVDIHGQQIEYTCDDVVVEKSYKTTYGIYKPDATVITNTGEEIFVEYNYSNKKKVSDYVDRWIELNCTVIELDIHKIDKSDCKIFKPVFYNGESMIDNDIVCHSVIRKCLSQDDLNNRKKIKYLGWVLRDLEKYNSGEISIKELAITVDNLNGMDKQYFVLMVKGLNCTNVLNDYAAYKFDRAKHLLNKRLEAYGLPCGKYAWMVQNGYSLKCTKCRGVKFDNAIKIIRYNYSEEYNYSKSEYNMTYDGCEVFFIDYKKLEELINESIENELFANEQIKAALFKKLRMKRIDFITDVICKYLQTNIHIGDIIIEKCSADNISVKSDKYEFEFYINQIRNNINTHKKKGRLNYILKYTKGRIERRIKNFIIRNMYARLMSMESNIYKYIIEKLNIGNKNSVRVRISTDSKKNTFIEVSIRFLSLERIELFKNNELYDLRNCNDEQLENQVFKKINEKLNLFKSEEYMNQRLDYIIGYYDSLQSNKYIEMTRRDDKITFTISKTNGKRKIVSMILDICEKSLEVNYNCKLLKFKANTYFGFEACIYEIIDKGLYL